MTSHNMATAPSGSEQRRRKSSLSQDRVFPEVVLFKIFSTLSVHDLGKACLVCKQWNSVVRSDVVWKRFVPKWPWFEPPTGTQGAYQIVKKLWTEKCVRIGNERWMVNPIPELVRYEMKLAKAEYHYYCQCHSSITLLARLNPCYDFTTKGNDLEDETMNNACEEIWKKLGSKDGEKPLEVHCHQDVMKEATFSPRQKTMLSILKRLEPAWFLEGLELEPYTLDEDGEIIDGGGENRKEGDELEEEEDDIPEEFAERKAFHSLFGNVLIRPEGDFYEPSVFHEELRKSSDESIFGLYDDENAWKTRINKRLPVELYQKIKAFFVDGSDWFVQYALSDGCYNENFHRAYFLVISDTAVFHFELFIQL